VDPPVAAGVPAPANPPSQVINPVSVTIAGIDAQFNSAVLTPGASGLYQVSVTVPGGIPSGDVQVLVGVAGQTSAPVTVTAK
jgi:uncharacterized protein (TIGR03437 family)